MGNTSAAAASQGRTPAQSWSTYLSHAMHAAGITNDAQLAERAGLSQSLVSRWRKGSTKPSDDSLRKLSRALEIPYTDLLVASGQASARELGLRGTPQPPTPRARRVDERLLSEVEDLSDAQVQRVRDFVKGLRGNDEPRQPPASGR